jgi:hypothetical protein
VNPATARCPAALADAAGITCPALGNGIGAYLQWDIAQGIHLDGEWARWSDAVIGGTDSGVAAVVSWDLGMLLKAGHSLALTTGYQFYGVNFYPPYGTVSLDSSNYDLVYPGNARGFTATLSIEAWEGVSPYIDYLAGSSVSNGQAIQEYEAGVIWKFSTNATLTVLCRDLRISDVDQMNLWRGQIDYSF